MIENLRQHQKEAIDAIDKSLSKGQIKISVQMIQGSGITLTCIAAIQLLLEKYKLKNINIVFDRKLIQEQLKHLMKNEIGEIPNNLHLFTHKNYDYSNEDSSDALIAFDLQENHTQLKNYVNEYKGIVIEFLTKTETIDNATHPNEKSTLIYKYSLTDAIRNISNFYEDNKLSELQIHLKNISKFLSENTGMQIDHNVFQFIAREYRLIDKLLEKISFENHETNQVVKSIVEYKISQSDIKEIGNRKMQLDKFRRLLDDENYFNEELKQLNGGPESVWQKFFEENNWIIGYGLTQVFLTSLNEKKLEQVVSGFTFNSSGKRVDALMKSRGIAENLCFIELKTHNTELLHKTQYRQECWQPSSELSGAISQIQKTVFKAQNMIREKEESIDREGAPTGEVLFNYAPKAFLIIGNLNQFKTPNGINMVKYSSFELFRKNIHTPEIITFDELYEKAKFIVEYR